MIRLRMLYCALACPYISLVAAGVAARLDSHTVQKRQPAAQADSRIDINSLQSVSPEQLDTLSFYAQFAAASYCDFNNEHPEGGQPLECDGRATVVQFPVVTSPMTSRFSRRQEQIDVCPRVEKESTVTTFEFRDQGIFDSTGYVAVDRTRKEIILAYRGTHSFEAFIGDLYAYPTTNVWHLCAFCTVHSGFWTTFQLTQDSMTTALLAAVADPANKDYKVIVTGHSLGGALATIAAIVLRQENGLNLDLYTYGSPRVGDWPFVYHLSKQSKSGKGSNARISHVNDPVPGLPPRGPLYSHYWPQYYITSGNGVPVTTNDIKVSGFWGGLPDPTDAEGIVHDPPSAFLALLPPIGFDVAPALAACITLPNIAAHLWYFASVSGCDPKTEPSFAEANTSAVEPWVEGQCVIR